MNCPYEPTEHDPSAMKIPPERRKLDDSRHSDNCFRVFRGKTNLPEHEPATAEESPPSPGHLLRTENREKRCGRHLIFIR